MTNTGDWKVVRQCAQLATVTGPPKALLAAYPDCAPYVNGTNPNQEVVVEGNFNGTPAQIAAALGITFGASGWFALLLHIIAVEFYVRDTIPLRNTLKADTICSCTSRQQKTNVSVKCLSTASLNVVSSTPVAQGSLPNGWVMLIHR